MKRSTERISRPTRGDCRAPSKWSICCRSRRKDGADSGDLDAAVARAIEDVVEKRVEAGVDVINDGEQARPDYTTHVKDRLTGCEGRTGSWSNSRMTTI